VADKEFPLSIVLRTVDKATAGINAVNKRLDAMTKPVRDFGKSLKDLGEKSGLNSVLDGFKDVGSAIGDLLGKVAMIGGLAGVGVAALVHLVGEFDDLGDKAERLGIHTDFLAGLGFAAERSGASVAALDGGFETFIVNLGLARAGMGKMVKALQTVAPDLLVALKHTKSNEQALLLMADAFAAIKDPAKKAALAARTGLGPELVPLLARGSKGVAELLARFHELAPGIGEAAEKAGAVDDGFKELKASFMGVKAAIVTGLAPAMGIVVDKLRDWFVSHREDIAQWAAQIGDRIPAAIEKVVTWVGAAIDKVVDFVDSIGGLKTVGIAAAAFMTGPLLSAFVTLGAAMLATPFGQVLAGLAAITAAATLATSAAIKLGHALGQKFIDIADRRDQEELDRELAKSGITRVRAPALTDAELAARQQTSSTGAGSEARIKVDFLNAPPGTRVKADPRSTADVDLSVGYQLAGFGP
jgi:hypothetical protein